MRTVAALFIDPRGPYPKLEGVDAWGESLDARLYSGPYPVVAHPPCGPWSSLRHLSRRLDGDCALRALEQVRTFGGVLEHPWTSKLWTRLPAPGDLLDGFGGWTVDVEQVSWGHVARKKTRLYLVGVSPELVTRTMRTGGTPTHWVSGRRGMGKSYDNVPPGIKVCSAEQRRRTPPLFAEWLVSLARASQV